MKLFIRILIILYSGFIAYSIALFVSGEAGIRPYREKMEYRNALLDNIDELNTRQTRLMAELKTLRRSAEKNRVFARKLGYYGSNEYKVVTPFKSGTEKPLYIGKILSYGKVENAMSNLRIAMTITLALIIMTLFILLLRQRRH